MATTSELASTIGTWVAVILALIALLGVVTPLLVLKNRQSERFQAIRQIDSLSLGYTRERISDLVFTRRIHVPMLHLPPGQDAKLSDIVSWGSINSRKGIEKTVNQTEQLVSSSTGWVNLALLASLYCSDLKYGDPGIFVQNRQPYYPLHHFFLLAIGLRGRYSKRKDEGRLAYQTEHPDLFTERASHTNASRIDGTTGVIWWRKSPKEGAHDQVFYSQHETPPSEIQIADCTPLEELFWLSIGCLPLYDKDGSICRVYDLYLEDFAYYGHDSSAPRTGKYATQANREYRNRGWDPARFIARHDGPKPAHLPWARAMGASHIKGDAIFFLARNSPAVKNIFEVDVQHLALATVRLHPSSKGVLLPNGTSITAYFPRHAWAPSYHEPPSPSSDSSFSSSSSSSSPLGPPGPLGPPWVPGLPSPSGPPMPPRPPRTNISTEMGKLIDSLETHEELKYLYPLFKKAEDACNFEYHDLDFSRTRGADFSKALEHLNSASNQKPPTFLSECIATLTLSSTEFCRQLGDLVGYGSSCTEPLTIETGLGQVSVEGIWYPFHIAPFLRDPPSTVIRASRKDTLLAALKGWLNLIMTLNRLDSRPLLNAIGTLTDVVHVYPDAFPRPLHAGHRGKNLSESELGHFGLFDPRRPKFNFTAVHRGKTPDDSKGPLETESIHDTQNSDENTGSFDYSTSQSDYKTAVSELNTGPVANPASQVDESKYVINWKDYHGTTPLMSASKAGHLETVKLLLENDAKPSGRNNHEQSELERAASKGHTEIVKLLIQKGWDINSSLSESRLHTPLMAAAGGSHYETLKLLLDEGAELRGVDLSALVLQYAPTEVDMKIVRLLVEKGADVEGSHPGGWTPLMSVSEKGDADTVKLLLEKGADPTAADHFGTTALSQASALGHHEVVKHLLDAGAANMEVKPYRVQPAQTPPFYDLVGNPRGGAARPRDIRPSISSSWLPGSLGNPGGFDYN